MIKALIIRILRTARQVSDQVGSAALAFVPALSLAAYWTGGEPALLAVALGLPCIMMAGAYLPQIPRDNEIPTRLRPLDSRTKLETALDQAVTHFVNGGANSVCVEIRVTPLPTASQARALGVRLKGSVRFGDVVTQSAENIFTACIQANDNLTVDAAEKIVRRLRQAIVRPILVEGQTQAFSCTIGYCTASLAPDVPATSFLDAAKRAADAAVHQGEHGMRLYEPKMGGQTLRAELVAQVHQAFQDRHIQPWFQPQFSVDGQTLIGVEALVRWIHPSHGMITPNEFLSAIRQAGAWSKLTDHMIDQSLQTLAFLDRQGAFVPTVGVNFAQEDLQDPTLVDRISWALDRHGLPPERLTVEVLENVVAAGTDDQVQKTLTTLSEMGCRIDLDDFGTGHASIASLRDLKLDRVKIDRSYLANIDNDTAQVALLETIALMAQRLGFETLAEGIETQSQLDMVRKIGCTAVQGFGLAKPMSGEHLAQWMVNSGNSQNTPVRKSA